MHAPGSTIVVHEVWHGRVWAARPVVVVEDTADGLLLWMPQGTERAIPATPPTRPDPRRRRERTVEMLLRNDWVHTRHVWRVSTLMMLRPGNWHAVWVSWTAPGRQLGWYVNLQRPYAHTTAGIVATDLLLDVVAEPDLSWRWKDADEFGDAVDRGAIDADLAARVRREADDVVGRIERRAAPFDEPWPDWRPDPSWGVPELPPHWREMPELL